MGETRLPVAIALGPVRLRVADTSRAAGWLERVLGLRELGGASWGASPATPLVALREVRGARAVPRHGRLGLYHYALLLPSRVELGRFILHLESLCEPWGASDHLVSEALYLTDPDGLTVEVYADRPREHWTRTGDSLDMALDPLDRDAIVAAAGDGRWRGMPEGARMGHLHFFVGDLAHAERHYVAGIGIDVTTRRLRGALFMSAGGYHHHVATNVWAAGAPVAGPEDAGLDGWTLGLGSEGEVESLRGRLDAAGIAYEADGEAVVVRDPWDIRMHAGAVPAWSP